MLLQQAASKRASKPVSKQAGCSNLWMTVEGHVMQTSSYQHRERDLADLPAGVKGIPCTSVVACQQRCGLFASCRISTHHVCQAGEANGMQLVVCSTAVWGLQTIHLKRQANQIQLPRLTEQSAICRSCTPVQHCSCAVVVGPLWWRLLRNGMHLQAINTNAGVEMRAADERLAVWWALCFT